MKSVIEEIQKIDVPLSDFEKRMDRLIQENDSQKQQYETALRACGNQYLSEHNRLTQCIDQAKRDHNTLLYSANQRIQQIQKQKSDASAEEMRKRDLLRNAEYDAHRQKIALIDSKLRSIPQEYIQKAYSVAKSRNISKQDLDTYWKKLNDAGLWALIKRLLKIQGYDSKKKMIGKYVEDAVSLKLFLNDLLAQRLSDVDRSVQDKIDQIALQFDGKIQNERRCIQDSENTRDGKIASYLTQEKQAENQKKHAQQAAEDKKNRFLSDWTVRRNILINEKNAFLDGPCVTEYASRMYTVLRDTGVIPDDWDSYDPKSLSPRYVTGEICIPSIVKADALKDPLSQRLNRHFSREGYRVPLLFQSGSAVKAYVHFDENGRMQMSEWIQNFILQKMRCEIYGMLSVDIVDPVQRGGTLGELNAPIEENQEIGIRTANGQDDIRTLLKNTVRYIDRTTGLLGTKASVAEYNLTAGNKRICERILILCDADRFLDTAMLSELKVIWNNAEKCGVHIIVTSSLPVNYVCSDHGADTGFLNSHTHAIRIAGDGSASISMNGKLYPLFIRKISDKQRKFIPFYRKLYETYCAVDNIYAHYHDITAPHPYGDATNGISLPILIRNEIGGELKNFNIGTQGATHTLITGNTGSGKTTFLHTIISSITARYHPDDVELWLLDYSKVEFKRYLTARPPHVRFISLEKTKEFTKSFLEFLNLFFTRRENLFKANNVSSLKEYRSRFGARSMPRVVLIVDEFHVMTQAVRYDTALKSMLENALTEYRKFGLSCIFSNQTTEALDGLTETGKMQIGSRVAMRNVLPEIKNTLAVSADNYTDDMIRRMERTSEGELWYKDRLGGNDFVINDFKALYLSEKELKTMLTAVCSRNDTATVDHFCFEINGLERKKISDTELQTALRKTESEKSIFHFCLGHPVRIENVFGIHLLKKYNQNVLLTGRNTESTFEILAAFLRCARYNKGKTVILADPENAYYTLLKQNFFDLGTNVTLLDDYSSICGFIKETKLSLDRKQASSPTFVIWLGISDLYDEFIHGDGYSENKAPANDFFSDTPISLSAEQEQELMESFTLGEDALSLGISLEDIANSFAAAEENDFGFGDFGAPAPQKPSDRFYNASSDMIALFGGGKYGVCNLVVTETPTDFSRIKGLNRDLFDHKISTAMAKQELVEFGYPHLQVSELELDAVNAVYSNRLSLALFKPYRFLDSTAFSEHQIL